jgi:hypothetical protein
MLRMKKVAERTGGGGGGDADVGSGSAAGEDEDKTNKAQKAKGKRGALVDDDTGLPEARSARTGVFDDDNCGKVRVPVGVYWWSSYAYAFIRACRRSCVRASMRDVRRVSCAYRGRVIHRRGSCFFPLTTVHNL